MSKTDIDITICTETDYPILLKIWESAVLTTHDFLSKVDFLFYKSKLSSYFENLDLYKLMSNGEIKGFIGIEGDKLEMLFVDSKFIGKGFGKVLLNYAIINLGITKVDVNEQNIQALSFYKHFGFISEGYSKLDGEGKEYPIISLVLE